MIGEPTDDTATDVSYYVPIFRDGRIERTVVEEFGGLERFRNRARQPLPLIELVDDGDVERLESYREMSDDVLVDVPVYLTEYDNEYEESVRSLLDDYANVAEFFNDTEEVEIPILSHLDTEPINYGEYLSIHEQLSQDFDQAGIRLFVSGRQFTDTQRSALENLANMVSKDTLVLFDLIDVGGFRDEERVAQKLERLEQLFDPNLTFVLNAFRPYEGTNVNHGPEIAREIGADGFGDFVVNRRIERNIPVGNNVDRRIRHYFPDDREINEFEGESYDEAQEGLTGDSDWDGDHCDFCRRAEAEGGHHSFWKEIRMGHYIDSVLAGEDGH